ncbi:prepilin peptidase CpaA [Litorimonas taeanensis]|uniref:Prepilin peptidase CpaA n=2 Tax=Litorimonas taeanensis TaxID=568099 RepID=A0A420WLZ9_9PROT|nr:prepilin peptidase CpaA [Litorimonas taeanensis]
MQHDEVRRPYPYADKPWVAKVIMPFVIFFSFSLCMLWAAITDASNMKISNRNSLAVVALFIIAIPFSWTGLPDLGEHLLVGLTVFAAGFIMFALGWLGGGDAKLLAATSLWWTWADVFTYILWVGIIGGVLAALLLVGRKYAPVSIATSSWGYGLFKEEKQMPYGLALAAAALITLPDSAIFKAVVGL